MKKFIFALMLAAIWGGQVSAQSTPESLKEYVHVLPAVKAGKLKIPIGRKLPLKDAEQGHATVAKGGAGKLLLVVDKG